MSIWYPYRKQKVYRIPASEIKELLWKAYNHVAYDAYHNGSLTYWTSDNFSRFDFNDLVGSVGTYGLLCSRESWALGLAEEELDQVLKEFEVD